MANETLQTSGTGRLDDAPLRVPGQECTPDSVGVLLRKVETAKSAGWKISWVHTVTAPMT